MGLEELGPFGGRAAGWSMNCSAARVDDAGLWMICLLQHLEGVVDGAKVVHELQENEGRLKVVLSEGDFQNSPASVAGSAFQRPITLGTSRARCAIIHHLVWLASR